MDVSNGMDRELRQYSSMRWSVLISATLLPFFLTIYLRILYIGGPPFTDEGIYGAIARSGDLTFGFRVNFYQWLSAFVGIPESTPLFHLRIFDMVWAALASGLMALWLLRWSTWPIATTIACAWAVLNNSPVLVNCGYKNPILAATALLLLALMLVTSTSHRAAFIGGLVVCGAVAFREAFLFTPLATAAIALLHHGRRGLVSHSLGLATGSIAVLAVIAAHDSLFGVIGRYGAISSLYEHLSAMESASRWWDQGRRAFLIGRWFLLPLPMFILALWCPPKNLRFGLLVAAILMLPFLPEVMTFRGWTLSYHFAQLSLGLAVTGALGLASLATFAERFPLAHIGWPLLAITAYVLFSPTADSYHKAAKLSDEFSPVMIHGIWDHRSIDRSTYLALSAYLRRHAPAGATVVASGHACAVNILAMRDTPSPRVYDLAILSRGCSEKQMQKYIAESPPPDYIVDCTRYPEDLSSFWPEFSEKYELVFDLPIERRRHYNLIGGQIWRRKSVSSDSASSGD